MRQCQDGDLLSIQQHQAVGLARAHGRAKAGRHERIGLQRFEPRAVGHEHDGAAGEQASSACPRPHFEVGTSRQLISTTPPELFMIAFCFAVRPLLVPV